MIISGRDGTRSVEVVLATRADWFMHVRQVYHLERGTGCCGTARRQDSSTDVFEAIRAQATIQIHGEERRWHPTYQQQRTAPDYMVSVTKWCEDLLDSASIDVLLCSIETFRMISVFNDGSLSLSPVRLLF